MSSAPTLRQIAQYLQQKSGMRCNCDLDNWEPERETGHSFVCRIHKAAKAANAELIAEAANAKRP